jgi:polyisoprenoid-binding protein YceI
VHSSVSFSVRHMMVSKMRGRFTDRSRPPDQINRKDFGIDTDMSLDGGGVVIGDTVQISLDMSRAGELTCDRAVVAR